MSQYSLYAHYFWMPATATKASDARSRVGIPFAISPILQMHPQRTGPPIEVVCELMLDWLTNLVVHGIPDDEITDSDEPDELDELLDGVDSDTPYRQHPFFTSPHLHQHAAHSKHRLTVHLHPDTLVTHTRTRNFFSEYAPCITLHSCPFCKYGAVR
ncbi:hypothetical protein EDC04DRAFT_2614208 [Pisolithus marmoratus]|nr:hypothetical protein EDC04DRAFT_2614208 [Pisolithus marmoratus]